jgi:chromatin assembly factor 1 subunit B
MNQQHKTVWAIATCDSIFVYHSESPDTPMLVASDLHYFSVTDLAWSYDGRWLIASSRDGFCTIISFAAGELGEVVKRDIILPQSAPADAAVATPRVANDAPEVSATEPAPLLALDQARPCEVPAAAAVAASSEALNVLEPPSLEESAVRDGPAAPEPPKKKRITPTLLSAPSAPVLNATPASVAESFGLEPSAAAAAPLVPTITVAVSASASSPLPALPSLAAAVTPLSPTQLASSTPVTLDKASAPPAPSSSGRKRVQPTLLAMLGAANTVQPVVLE